MKEFMKKNRHNISNIINAIIIAIGLLLKNVVFVFLGILLIGLNYYVLREEKKAEEKKALIKAEIKANKAKMQGNKKKKSKKKKRR